MSFISNVFCLLVLPFRMEASIPQLPAMLPAKTLGRVTLCGLPLAITPSYTLIQLHPPSNGLSMWGYQGLDSLPYLKKKKKRDV